MDEAEVARFGREFTAFLEAVNRIATPAEGSPVRAAIEEHLGRDADRLPVVADRYLPFEHVKAYVDDIVTVSEEDIRAAVAVLEAAGFEVVVPAKPVCCGLTWISTGQLTRARRVLTRSLGVLAPHLEAGTPIVGLEPSCTAAFRHDAPALLVDNPLAASAAANIRTFSELLVESSWQPPQVGGAAFVQPHCHQHAVLGFDADRKLMAAAGIEAGLADPGCCGLAGNFGFERDHYDVSKAVGERTLLPAVRSLPETTAVLADGFSCRTQIAQATPRTPSHLAQVLAEALPPRPS